MTSLTSKTPQTSADAAAQSGLSKRTVHDLNNMLGSIMGAAQILDIRLADADDSIRDYIQILNRVSKQLAQVVRDAAAPIPTLAPARTPTQEQPATSTTLVPQHSGMILLIVHDDTLRTVMRSLLESNAYIVLDAASGTDGLRTFIDASDDIALTLLDDELSDMSAHHFLTQLHAHQARASSILLSTAAPSADVQVFVDAKTLGYLHKPFQIRDLMQLIGEHAVRGMT